METKEKRLIVSLTSYPARISTLHQVLETIYAQTRQADEVVLWLAREQFPEKEAELPEQLRNFAAEGKLTIRWCDDLKPHKKYFYALQEYSEDVVVTVDDDVFYPEHTLDALYRSWLRHPRAVSAMRAHLMVIDEQQKLLPYQDWVKETDACVGEPSMQLFATGAGGILYPPGVFRKEFFDREAILETCLWADDLWLKAMELVSDVPVVVAHAFDNMRHIPGTQQEALYRRNVDQNQNDIQLAQITTWLDRTFQPGIFMEKLTKSDIGTRIMGIEAVCLHFRSERRVLKNDSRMLHEKLNRTYAEKSEINAKLKRTYAEKSEINRQLREARQEIERLRENKFISWLKKLYHKFIK